MTDWQERVVAERAELDAKILKLKAFKATQAFRDLPDADAILLDVQLRHMESYSIALLNRITRFN